MKFNLSKHQEKVLRETIEKSKGHWVDYEWIDEDGTKKIAKAIPVTFFESWLSIGLTQQADLICRMIEEKKGSKVRLGKEAKKLMTAQGLDKPIAMQNYWDFCIDNLVRLIRGETK